MEPVPTQHRDAPGELRQIPDFRSEPSVIILPHTLSDSTSRMCSYPQDHKIVDCVISEYSFSTKTETTRANKISAISTKHCNCASSFRKELTTFGKKTCSSFAIT
ncbi:hypothetical protein ANN_00633 [Periplaneta americana]|uniref:Uncharacterized protein n=1 Tax=Periplaneta americana TaxID=6978 RepID=A0ABQ8TTR1_PERAM|nr:hypothetical protein ANN_00633 [Periplaneta americana]